MLGGIVFSAVLTFFVVPAAFYLFERTRVLKMEEKQAAEGANGGDEEEGELAPAVGNGRS